MTIEPLIGRRVPREKSDFLPSCFAELDGVFAKAFCHRQIC